MVGGRVHKPSLQLYTQLYYRVFRVSQVQGVVGLSLSLKKLEANWVGVQEFQLRYYHEEIPLVVYTDITHCN